MLIKSLPAGQKHCLSWAFGTSKKAQDWKGPHFTENQKNSLFKIIAALHINPFTLTTHVAKGEVEERL